MRKLRIAIVLCALAAALALTACDPPETPEEVVLSFDKTTAYISGSKTLLPIKGALPEAGDLYEEATVKLSASVQAKMRLTVEFSDPAIAGLAVSVNGGAAKDFVNGAELYQSAQAETEAAVAVRIFLSAAADEASAGRQLAFTFVLSYEEDV
ncbi:MAG: hypothetical protein LBH24_04570 [Clostridiales bacterium]|jgi:hypothetical protein|nr:hypothetical protein [Clostridiales bacterium]